MAFTRNLQDRVLILHPPAGWLLAGWFLAGRLPNATATRQGPMGRARWTRG